MDDPIEKLVADLRAEDAATFKNFVRMSAESFDWLLEKVSPKIKKKDTNMRQAISAEKRLYITLRFLATGILYFYLR